MAGNVLGSWIFCQDLLLQFPSRVLFTTWWLCGYFPVRMLALLGQQRALGTYCRDGRKGAVRPQKGLPEREEEST